MSRHPHHQTDLPWQPLLVKAAGACCAVGYNLAAASCALRAGMDHFQESEFVDRTGDALKVARLPLGNIWGAARLAGIAKMALVDCLKTVEDFRPATTALILLAAERGRPHTESERYNEIWHACVEHFAEPFHASSVISPQGRAGIGSTVQFAQKLLVEGVVVRVLILGVDSFLNGATMEYYLSQGRLLTAKNADGFIPGEAAGAILLQLSQAGRAGLHITGAAVAREQAQFGGDVPNRAIGLTQAMRGACEQAGRQTGDLAFRMSDQNGEEYFAKEMSNAYTRFSADDSKFLPMLHIADCVGETGAASGPTSIAFLSTLMNRADGPGEIGLMHFANDNGARAACVVEFFK